MTAPNKKTGAISAAAVVLMLTVVILSLYDAGFDNNAAYWALIMVLAVTVFYTLRNRLSYSIKLDQPLLWLALFILWAGISIFWSVNPHRTMVEFLQLNLYGFAFLLASSLQEHELVKVGRIALITGLGIALFGIAQYMFITTSRMSGTLGNPNIMAIYLAMLFFLGWGYFLRKENYYLAVLSVFLLVALALTGSRGTYLCFILALPFLFLGFKRSELKVPLLKTLLCIGAALIITQGIIYLEPLIHGIDEGSELGQVLARPEESVMERSGFGRFVFWTVGSRLALNEPVLGSGLGTFFLSYFTEYDGTSWYARFAHNHYLQTMAELGFTGFVLLAGFLLAFARKTWFVIRQKNYPLFFPGLLAAAIAFLIHAGGDYTWNFPATAVIFFIIAGGIIGLPGSDRNPSKKSSNYGMLVASMFVLILTAWQLSAALTYEQGATAEARGDMATAAEIYDRANAFYPLNSMAFSFASNSYYVLAREHNNYELFKEAIKRAERAVELSPLDANLHHNLGRLYWEAGRIEEAEHHLRLAVEYAGYRLGMYVDLSRFYIHQNQKEAAEKVINQGLELKDAARGTTLDEEMVEGQIEALYELRENI